MKKTKLIALSLVLALILNMIMPFMTVIAATNYTITFEATDGHTLVKDGDHLKIDDQFVDLRDSNNDTIGAVSVTGNTASITVSDGTEGELNYNSANRFTLYNTDGHVPYNMGTKISSNTVFSVENYTSGENNPGQPENPGTPVDEVIVEFDNANISGNTVTYNVGGTNVTLTVSGSNISNNEIRVDRNNLGSVSFNIGNTYNSETMQVIVRGADNYSDVLNVDSDNNANLNGLNFPGGGLHLSIENKNGGEPNPGQPEEPGPIIGTDNIEFDISVTATHIIASINNKTIVDDINGFKSTFKGTIEEAGTTNPAETNTILLNAPFEDAPLTNIVINNVFYSKTTDGVVFNEEDNSYIITVPGAAKYTIRAEADSNARVPKTIIWANPDYKPTDAANAEWVKDFTLKNGTAEVVEVRDENNKLVDPKDYIGESSENNGLNKGFGWVKVYSGYKVVFKFFPEYGYQLTEITLNETPMKAGEAMNTFTVEIPNDNNAGNVHFAATFTKTEDIVKANSEKVTSGKIDLGNKLSGGSAQLTVNDIELSSDKIKEFKNAAGDYTISNYLDIDLYQVFNKGTTDSNNVWSNKISELEKYATITMKLDEGVNADDVVIVHNIHDGEEYEIIKIDSYDPETNTITFRTKSFSNYAIATKGTTLITDSSTSDVKAIIKTEKELPANSKLVVKEIEIPEEILKEEKNLKKLFDISVLSSTGEVIKVSDNKLQITIELEEELQGYNTYKVVYINNGKIEETLPATVVDGKLTFETTHLSEYGIVAYNDKEVANPQTGDNIITIVTIFAISTFGVFWTAKLNKNRKVRKH